MGMADEKCRDRFDDTFCQVMDPPAIQEDPLPQGPDEQVEKRVVQQTGEKSRFKFTERELTSHDSSPVSENLCAGEFFLVISIFPGNQAKGKRAWTLAEWLHHRSLLCVEGRECLFTIQDKWICAEKLNTEIVCPVGMLFFQDDHRHRMQRFGCVNTTFLQVVDYDR